MADSPTTNRPFPEFAITIELPDSENEAFIAVSMYARWLTPHPSTKSRWRVGYSDASAHRIISDLSAFIGHRDPATHRIPGGGRSEHVLRVDRRHVVTAGT